MEDDGKDEDLEEFGETREECSARTGLCCGCVMGTFPLSNVNGMRLDQLVGGGGFPFGRCYCDSYIWADCKEVPTWRVREGRGRERDGGKG